MLFRMDAAGDRGGDSCEFIRRVRAAPPAPEPPPPLFIGRDLREPGQVIGKKYLLRVWLTDVAVRACNRCGSCASRMMGILRSPASRR